MAASPAFCFEARAVDGVTRVFVNVGGNDRVGAPLFPNHDAIHDPAYLDERGVDNLAIPIAVGELEDAEVASTTKCFVVDVVVHTWLTQRCHKGHHLHDHFVERLTNLARDWVIQETGVRLLPSSIRVLEELRVEPKHRKKESQDATSRHAAMMEELARALQAKPAAAEATRLPEALNLAKSTKETISGGRAKVVEMPCSSSEGIKRGFLLGEKATALYGPEGTKEGVLPEGAGDPLGYLPKGLRDKCKIVDMSKEQVSVSSPPPATQKVPQPTPNICSEVKEAEQHPLNQPQQSQVPKIEIADVSVEQRRRAWEARFYPPSSSADPLTVGITVPENVCSMSDIKLNVTSNAIECSTAEGTFVVPIPQIIDVETAKATFVRKKHLLKISAMKVPQ